MHELQLIQKAQDGDHDAFIALLANHDRQIMSVVYRFTGDRYDREDLYQEVFMHAFQSIRRYRGEAAFATWLYRVALNRCIRYMNKKPEREELPEIGVTPENGEQRARLRAIHRAMGRLKGPQRISFHLFYIEEWTAREIAEVLACSEGTVKSHLNRARGKIKGDWEVLQWQMNPS